MKSLSYQFRNALPEAHWIWIPGETGPVNALAEFCGQVTLQENDLPGARIFVCADNRYHLWINGRWRAYGPGRSHPGRARFDVLDVDDFLEVGENELLVRVLHWGEGTFQSYVQRAGLLLDMQARDGRTLLATDEHWRGRIVTAWQRNTQRIACQLGFEEQIDARQTPAPWDLVDVVGESGCPPWGNLRPIDIPPLQEESWSPVSISITGKSEVDWHRTLFSLRAGDYLLPNNRMVNGDWVEGCFATRFKLERRTRLTVRRSAMYGDSVTVFVNDILLPLEQDIFDLSAELDLPAGEHLLVLDWEGLAHDRDLSLLLEARYPIDKKPWPPDQCTWLFFTGQWNNISLTTATEDMLAMAKDTIPVAPEHTPHEDVYLEMAHRSFIEDTGKSLSLGRAIIPQKEGEDAWTRIIYDFGKHGFGFVEIELEAPEGMHLQGAGIEGLNAGNLQFTELANNTFSYICREGRQIFRSHVLRGFRYLVLDVAEQNRPGTIEQVRFNQYTYPWNPKGAFHSSNERLNEIYQLSCHTLRVSSSDTFIDATYEQALWVGDFASMILRVHYYVQGEHSLPERCLRMTGESLERLPMVNSQVPSSWENRIIPNWSFLWAMGIKDHVLYSGNINFGREMLPLLRQQAEFVDEQLNSDGLFQLHENVWHFLDWNHPEAGEQTARERRVYCHENCLAVAAFKASASVAEWCGDEVQADWFRAFASSLEAAVLQSFWDEDEQAFAETISPTGNRDSVFAASTQICALMAGLQVDDKRSLSQRILQAPPHWRSTGTPWMWALGARYACEVGMGGEVVEGILKEWGTMIDSGATAAWEMFEGNHRPGLATRSWAHGWSAGPAWLLPAYVLGVRPLAPGWSEFVCNPSLTHLEIAEGTVPTPFGPIKIICRKNGDRVEVNVEQPKECKRAREESLR
jgi:hypothetical protein